MSTTNSPNTTNSAGRILLVDDDPISLAQVQALMRVEGFEVVPVPHPVEALRLLASAPATFDAVLTDFLMPEINGIELMKRAHLIDAALSVIIITSDTERTTISDSIKGGAVDFLEKPVSRAHIRDSLGRGVARSRHQRDMHMAMSRLGTVASIQQRLSPSFSQQTPQGMRCSLTTCLHPIHEAGGDFLSIFHDQESRAAIALGDISGHGVLEGFIASYFQGLVKGMQIAGSDSEAIATECNRFLMRDWNSGNLADLSTSLSAAFVTLDLSSMSMNASNYGCPSPILYSEGTAPRHLAHSGSPLGWFDNPSGTHESFPAPQSATCFLWSDGIPDTAALLNASPFALATRVLTERSLPDLSQVPDDILVARLDWHPVHLPAPSAFPVLHKSLAGDTSGKIDSVDAEMKASLSLAISSIQPALVEEITLCTREATLNALNHGCLGNPSLHASILVEFLPATRIVRVTVSDPGPGHSHRLTDSPPDLEAGDHISLGLQLIRSLATAFRFSRSGATLTMDFLCP